MPLNGICAKETSLKHCKMGVDMETTLRHMESYGLRGWMSGHW
jgi:hypothetical protein